MMHDILFYVWRPFAQLWNHADMAKLVEVRGTYMVMSLNRLDQVRDLSSICHREVKQYDLPAFLDDRTIVALKGDSSHNHKRTVV
jgi:hypothetical protein